MKSLVNTKKRFQTIEKYFFEIKFDFKNRKIFFKEFTRSKFGKYENEHSTAQ